MNRALALVDPADESHRPGTADAAATARPLLETKLYAPRSRDRLVARPRLSSALRDRDAHRLTLVCAPAGFGKSTLLGEWVAAAGADTRVAWLSLDAGDNDPWLFWSYVSRALQTAQPDPPRAIRQRDVDAFVTTLINAIAADDTNRLLILDDYHVIDEPSVHDSVALLLDRLPPQLRVVIASRSVPPIGLSRLRARGELVELLADDLRFTADEAGAFFKQVMALDLTASDVTALGQRTEGWIAGLKLAALSMRGRDDRNRFIETFSGENRHVADYLVDEVVQLESAEVRNFLLATSVLDRLSAPLCDAVTGEPGSQAMLEDLDRRNLFVVPLDDRREWYRYHHLFADVLQRQSRNTAVLHARASDWFDQNGATPDAIRHAVKSGDASRVARLLERSWPEKDRSYESASWLARAKALPDEVVRARPVLAMGYAWALLNSGELEAAEAALRDVERGLQSDPAQLVIGDDVRFQSLATELASARIYLDQSRGDIPQTLDHSLRALETIPEHDHAARATGIALVALAHWGRGELTSAHDSFLKALDAMRSGGRELDAIRGTFVPADIRAAQGRLCEAAAIYRHGLEVAARSPGLAGAETGELYLGLSELHREWNDLAAAKENLDTFERHQATASHAGNLQRWCVAMARVHQARGETDRALELLAQAETHERRDPLPRARPIPAMRARLQLARGDAQAAASWARAAMVSIDDELSYLREFDHLTLARLLIERKHDRAELVGFLDRLRLAAQTGGRIGSVIEILVLQSLTHHTFGNARASLDALAEALTFAEPEGFLRVFVDEGIQVRDLLRTAAARGLAGAYTRTVLTAFEGPSRSVAVPAISESAAPSGQTVTSRELEILRLIASGLRNAEIAETLAISQATVKRHIANVYAKLGAEHRTEALVRAAELKLL